MTRNWREMRFICGHQMPFIRDNQNHYNQPIVQIQSISNQSQTGPDREPKMKIQDMYHINLVLNRIYHLQFT